MTPLKIFRPITEKGGRKEGWTHLLRSKVEREKKAKITEKRKKWKL